MKQELITKVIQEMLGCLDNSQLSRLKQTMVQVLGDYDISETHCSEKNDSDILLQKFIAAKRIEGRSEKTLQYYKKTIETMIKSIDVKVNIKM